MDGSIQFEPDKVGLLAESMLGFFGVAYALLIPAVGLEVWRGRARNGRSLGVPGTSYRANGEVQQRLL